MGNYIRPRSISVSNELWDQVKEQAEATGQSASAIVVQALGTHFRSQVIKRSSWDTDDEAGWYDPDKLYTFSQDKHGHSAKVELHIPKMVAGEIAGIIDSGKFPELRGPQDFYRNAIRHMAYRFGRMVQDDAVVESAHVMTILDRIATDKAETAETLKLISDMTELLDNAIDLGHLAFAENRLEYLWEAASSITERFREEYVETLKAYRQRIRVAKAKAKNTGEIEREDGSRIKNGVELQPRAGRRRNPVD